MAYPALPSYPGSKAQSSQGVGIWVNYGTGGVSTSPPTWVFIGECLSAKFSDKNMFEDSTNLQSTAKEFLPVLQDPGKLTVKLNRVSTDPGQAAITALRLSQVRCQFSVVLPLNAAAGQTVAGDQRNFQAYVESNAPDIGVNKKIDTDFMLQISGPITDVEGS